MTFKNRKEAGKQLAKSLKGYKHQSLVVYALPRGGAVLGKEVARALGAPLDLLIPRKIGHPQNPEYAIAAVTETGDVVKNEADVAVVDQEWFDKEVGNQRAEAKRRRKRYVQDQIRTQVRGKIGMIIDDGVATGLTMKAAIKELEQQEPSRIIVAVPVAPKDTIRELEKLVDEVVVLHAPVFFIGSIGAYYQTFDQVSDEEVEAIMKEGAVS